MKAFPEWNDLPKISWWTRVRLWFLREVISMDFGTGRGIKFKMLKGQIYITGEVESLDALKAEKNRTITCDMNHWAVNKSKSQEEEG